MPQLVNQLNAIEMRSGWLDGEIVIMSKDGVPHFNALQNSLDHSTSSGIEYFLFDILFYEGYDLR